MSAPEPGAKLQIERISRDGNSCAWAASETSAAAAAKSIFCIDSLLAP
jgi:hypothetical protein